MRIAICSSPNHIDLELRPIPPIDSGKVLVKVALCGICGTDLDVWRGSSSREYPYSPGHEFSGTVHRTGAAAARFHIGQRVVANPNLGCGECEYCERGKPNLCDYLKTRPVKSNGGLAEYVALDHRMVHPLPESLPEVSAVFIEPLSCALHAVRAAQVEPGERVGVFGAGTMGILTGIALRAAGCEVTFVEPGEMRRKQAAELLDTDAISPQELTRRGFVARFDVAIDCSGAVEAVSQAIGALRKTGRLILLGVVTDPGVDLPLAEVTMKELVIRGSWLNPNTFEEAIDLATEHSDILCTLRTEVFALDEIAAAFGRALSHEVHKVLVRP